jgi:hypothetical protein
VEEKARRSGETKLANRTESTEAARLKKDKTSRRKGKKKKTDLTLTGLLMEGPSVIIRGVPMHSLNGADRVSKSRGRQNRSTPRQGVTAIPTTSTNPAAVIVAAGATFPVAVDENFKIFMPFRT